MSQVCLGIIGKRIQGKVEDCSEIEHGLTENYREIAMNTSECIQFPFMGQDTSVTRGRGKV